MNYAVCLADLMRNTRDHELARMLVFAVAGGVIDAAPETVDGILVPLDCDAERADAICKLLRRKWGANDLRLFTGNGSTWRLWRDTVQGQKGMEEDGPSRAYTRPNQGNPPAAKNGGILEAQVPPPISLCETSHIP